MRLNKENYEEELKNPMYIAIGAVVFLLVVVLFCVIVWNVTHAGGDQLVIKDDAVQKEEATPEPEETPPVVETTPEPEPTPDPAEVALQQLIAEKSNDQGMVFTDIRDTVTAVGVTNLRSEPSTAKKNETVVTTLNNGQNLVRVGYNEAEGWSKLVYNDTIVYASTQYLVIVEETVE